MLRFFKALFGAKSQYLMIAGQSEEDKQKVTRLGVQSLILAIVGTVLVLLCVYFGTVCAQNVTSEQVGDGTYNFPIMSFVGAIILYCFALAIFLSLNLSSISFASYQMKVNKKAIGKVALAVSLVCGIGLIIATIVMTVVML